MFVRRLGLTILGIVVAVFAALGVLLAPRAVIIGVVVLTPVVGVFALMIPLSSSDRPSPAQIRAARRTAVLAAAVAVVAFPILTGIITVLGAAAVPIMLLLCVAAAPLVWTRVRPRITMRQVQHHRPNGGEFQNDDGPVEPDLGLVPVPLATEIKDLSTPALCGEWRRSYLALERADDRQHREQIAELRRRYLDEIARRHPHEFSRWIETARAGSDPSKFLPPAPARDSKQSHDDDANA